MIVLEKGPIKIYSRRYARAQMSLRILWAPGLHARAQVDGHHVKRQCLSQFSSVSKIFGHICSFDCNWATRSMMTNVTFRAITKMINLAVDHTAKSVYIRL